MFEKGLQILGLLALGGGAVLAAAAGAAALTAFVAINLAGYAGFAALGDVGDRIGPGYRDILQGTAGIFLVGAMGIKGYPGNAENLLPEVRKVRLEGLNYSQGDVSPTMRDGRAIEEVAVDMRENGWDGTKDPPDMVEWDDESLTTLDHRRIVAAKQAGLEEVPANVHPSNEPIDPNEAGRFQLLKNAGFTDPETGVTYLSGDEPTTWGEAAKFRAANQRVMGYPDFPLRGTPDVPQIRGK
jgi:hypothetical protein